MSNEDDKTIIRFVIILVIVLLCCVGFYFATKYIVNKEENETNETKEVEINNDVAIIGTMLNKKDNEYYVLIFDNNSKDIYTYQMLLSQYKAKDNSLKVYTVDLGNALNKPYYDKDNTNPKATELKDLRFGDITLIKVENKKITNAYESVDEVKLSFFF